MTSYIYLAAAVAFLAILIGVRIRQLRTVHSMGGPMDAARPRAFHLSPIVKEARAARKAHRELRNRIAAGPVVRVRERLLQARDATGKHHRAACNAAPNASSRPMSAA